MTKTERATLTAASAIARTEPRKAAEMVLTVCDINAQSYFFADWPRVRYHIQGTLTKGYSLREEGEELGINGSRCGTHGTSGS